MADLVPSKVRFSSFTVSDGTEVSLSEDDVLIVVGPNNAGKSQLLRDLENHFELARHGVYSGKVVTSTTLVHDPVETILEAFEKLRENGSEFYSAYSVRAHQNSVHNALTDQRKPVKFGGIHPFFLKRISSDDRLSIVAPSPAIGTNRIDTPGQLLYDSEELLTDVSAIFREAFGRDLFVDYRSGGNIPLYVGQKPTVPEGMDRVSDGYVNLVRACDKLHEQGDGMKSFGGILLSTLVVHHNITLIDEPEAFLHPPQERVIGRIIGKRMTGQVICSTHSKNVLQGFLESERNNIRVIRIVRKENVNNVSEISPDEVRELWQDPVFRYSTALDALFHEQTILCEAEPDCRFFEAVQGAVGKTQKDTHFVPCGGKAAFPKFIKALRKLSIPVLAILDIDVLNDEQAIKRIYEAQGGTWSEVQALWRRVDAAVRDGIPPASLEETKQTIIDLLKNWKDGNPPQSEIIDAIKKTKPWGKVKEIGIAAIPTGDAQISAEELFKVLAQRSIFPIPVGTLEKFVPTVGNHGIKWLNEVFERHSIDSSELRTAREFMAKVLG